MHTLKRVLMNEGVNFGEDHRRLTFGSCSRNVLHLCAAYDDLYKSWSAMLPENTLIPHQEEEALAESNDDSGCFMEDDVGGEAGVEAPVQDDLNYMQLEMTWDDTPLNIGWRFSDDIGEVTAAHYRDPLTLNGEKFQAMEEAFAVAVTVPLPNEDHSQPSASIELEHRSSH